MQNFYSFFLFNVFLACFERASFGNQNQEKIRGEPVFAFQMCESLRRQLDFGLKMRESLRRRPDCAAKMRERGSRGRFERAPHVSVILQPKIWNFI